MKYRVSVGKLVEFACRIGDLSLHGPQGPTALQGIKAHQKIQQEKPVGVQSEVRLKAVLQLGADELSLSGRLDLLDPTQSPPLIQEIKSTFVPPSRIARSVSFHHRAQLKMYGYCHLLQLRANPSYTLDASRDQVSLGLLWFNILDQSQTAETQLYSFESLEAFTLDAAQRYLQWIRKVGHWQRKTQRSAHALAFPYGEFRQGQRDLAAASYRVARDKGFLLCEAPTGIGKTVSTLFPVVKAIGDKHVSKVVYLTAKTSGREVALRTLSDLKRAGLEITYLVIQSKALVCHCSNGRCERDDAGRCPLTLGFFDRLPAARDELLDLGAVDVHTLDAVATHHQLCPFELALQMLPWVSLVICDYNYVFDPLVRLPAFSEPDKRLLLLLDESHNLIDRARSMYSARITRSQNQRVVNACAKTHPALSAALNKLTRALDRWARTKDESEWAEIEAPDDISKVVSRCIETISDESDGTIPLPEGTFDWFKELFRYVVIEDLYAEQHRTLTSVTGERGKHDVDVQLRCLNARDNLRQSFSLFRAAVAFSATLRPLEYYYQGLGMPDATKGMLLASPFDPARLGVYICPFIDTRYRRREQSGQALVELIHSVVSSRRGNYMVFFPSYAYMEKTQCEFQQAYPDISTVVQQRSSVLENREHFLHQFDANDAILGFAIMGGVFGEGVDYEGERLIGSILVGTGLPSLSMEQKLIAQNYAKAGLNGFDYTYRFPGFTRVLQTAGRVIRSERDTGVVILADSRFKDSFYHNLYPAHWNTELCLRCSELSSALSSFWQGQQGTASAENISPARVD